MDLIGLNTTINNYKTKVMKYHGKDHLVVPVVLLKEGVHHGSGGPVYYPAEELSKFPASWNGEPVPVMHPQEGNTLLSANDPGILEDQVIGTLFNVIWDSNGKKLKGEIWVDIGKAQESYPDAYQTLIDKKQMEVSTGLFHELDMVEGTWNDEKYEAVVKNIRPDHLALLPGAKGACSWEDGCGIRFNEDSLSIDVSEQDARRFIEHMETGESVTFNVKGGKIYNMKVAGGKAMGDTDKGKCCPEKIQMLIENDQLFWNEDHRELLDSFDEATVDAMIKVAEEAKEQMAANEDLTKKVDELTANVEELKAKVPAKEDGEVKPPTFEELLGNASPDVQASFKYGMGLAANHKAESIKTLLAYDSNPYQEDELKLMDNEQLQKLVTMVPTKKDFSGNSPNPVVNKGNEDDFCMPKEVIDKK